MTAMKFCIVNEIYVVDVRLVVSAAQNIRCANQIEARRSRGQLRDHRTAWFQQIGIQ